MLANYIKVSYRNLIKYKTYTLINIFGLSVGIASVLFIAIYVIDELQYDKFNKNLEQTYRIGVKGKITGENLNQAVTAPPMAAAIINNIPGALYVTRLARFGEWLVRYNSIRYNETEFLFADSSFFEVFSFPLVAGNKKTALKKPFSVVLTVETAKRYFEGENPIGKKLFIESDSNLYTVTGIVDPPKYCHFKFNLLGSLSTFRIASNPNWLTHQFYTYVVMKEGSSKKNLEKELNKFIDKYVLPQLGQITGNNLRLLSQKGDNLTYFAQPLKDIHLRSHLQLEITENGNINYVYTFTFIAILLLCIAIINFMNLATARSTTRAREIAMRKVMGSDQRQIIWQFLIESVFLSILALVISLVLVEVFTPYFQKLIQKEINLLSIENGLFLIFTVIIGIITGLLAGSYPAIVLAAYDTVSTLKGHLRNTIQTSKLRNILVTTQFSVSIFLLLCTLTIHRQINFMLHRNLGFNKEQVMVIKRSDGLKTNIDNFKKELLLCPEIQAVANSTHVPGKIYWRNAFCPENDPENTYLLNQSYVSIELADVLKLKINEGRFFSNSSSPDSNLCVINQTAVKYLKLVNPVGKIIYQPSKNTRIPYTIIGVVADFNYSSLHNPIEPMIMTQMRGNLEGIIIVRVSLKNLKKTIPFIRNTWGKYTSDYIFEYSWLNDDFNKLYNPDKVTASVFVTFSILSIFIACLGLFGLIAFNTAQRTKEIGIRKSFGASYVIIFYTITKDTLKLILLSLIIAWPAAYFVLHHWLTNFTYRTPMSCLDFVISAAVALIITLLTIGAIAIKAVLKNPADALRYE
jgi:putative ABC transport system permease protein